MPTTIHLAPVGAGKTEFALHRLLDFVHDPQIPFLKVWLLLATRRQEVTFRQRLVEIQSQSSVFFNVEFFNFYSLNARLLNIACRPTRQIQNSARISILRIIVQELLNTGDLPFFQKIAHTPGFITVIADLIDELKQNSVYPNHFEAGTQTQKDIEIARIYQLYQDKLQTHDLADVEGEGWLALEALKYNHVDVHHVDLLLVDGYDQFTPVQAQLIAELSRTIRHIDITLTTIPDRGADYAQRFKRARTRLETAHADAKSNLTIKQLERGQIKRHADLDLLGQQIFQTQDDHRQSDAIQFIEMPTPAEEVKAVLRDVKRQLLAGIQPDEILIALRDWSRYGTYFESYQSLYQLPIFLHHQPAYHKTPVISVLIDVLELAPVFRRRDLLDVLRSPYIESGLTSEQIDLLDNITAQRQFVRGTIDEWMDLIDTVSTRQFGVMDDDRSDLLLDEAEANDLSIQLQAFLQNISPPEFHDVESYVAWLERLIGRDPNSDPDDEASVYSFEDEHSLHMIRRVYEGNASSEAIIRRDIIALNGLKQILRHLLTSDLFVRSTLQQDTITSWRNFWSDLKLTLESTVHIPGNPSRTGRILVTTASDARGLPHDHVYILGMAEGVFPAEISEDPLYLDTEREQLKAAGILLETQAERIDDQGLFYELISLPRKTLTLSRPTVQDGKVWVESHLWRAVRQVFGGIQVNSMGIGQVVEPRFASSSDELLLSLADALNHDDASEIEEALSIQNWLKHHDTLHAKWQQIIHGRDVDNRRMSPAPHDHYSGQLAHPDLKADVADLLDDNYVWSASKLRDFAQCGFRFYAKRLLRLEEISEPEEGYDVLQLGNINHLILENTYKEIRDYDLTITPDNADKALDILHEKAEHVFEIAPEEFKFHANALWENEQSILLARLEKLIALDFSDESPIKGETRKIYALEKEFKNIRIPISNDIEPLRIYGFIDRIDIIDDQKLFIIDYKTGSTKIKTEEIAEGRNFQMMIYILALQETLKAQPELDVAGGMFWHLKNLETSGVFDTQNANDMQAIQDAREHIARYLLDGRSGKFIVQPTKLDNGKCYKYCEFSKLCRIGITNRNKIGS